MNQPEDVEVIIAHDRRYKFHSSVLARNSTRFAAMLTEPNAARLSSRARNAGLKVRWRVKLVPTPGINKPLELRLIPLDNMGQPAEAVNPLVINENGRVPSRVFDHYESIIYAFYNKEIPLKDDDMWSALYDALDIIDIAEYLGCVPLISRPVDVALVKHGQDLFRSISARPWAWITLAKRIKSELIFKEAIIHLAGNWRKVKSDENAMKILEDETQVMTLCERLHRELVQKGKKLEQGISSLYPGSMAQPSKDVPIKREEYAKDILVWMALSFFRHWFSQRIISEQGANGQDSGYQLYSQLGLAGDAYMDKSILNQFHTRFPMTKKALNVVENHLLELKECFKGVVTEHGILKSNCQLDVHRYPVDYLTCAVVTKDDFPWNDMELEAFEESQVTEGYNAALRNQELARSFAEAEQQERRHDGGDRASKRIRRS